MLYFNLFSIFLILFTIEFSSSYQNVISPHLNYRTKNSNQLSRDDFKIDNNLKDDRNEKLVNLFKSNNGESIRRTNHLKQLLSRRIKRDDKTK